MKSYITLGKHFSLINFYSEDNGLFRVTNSSLVRFPADIIIDKDSLDFLSSKTPNGILKLSNHSIFDNNYPLASEYDYHKISKEILILEFNFDEVLIISKSGKIIFKIDWEELINQ